MKVKDRLIKIVSEKLSIKIEDITPEAIFEYHLGADSLDMVELVMVLEEEFGIQIPEEDAGRIVTVGNAIEYIQSRLKEEASQ